MSWVADTRTAAVGLGPASLRGLATRAAVLGRAAKPRIVALFAVTVLVATLLAGPVSAGATAAVVAAAALTVAGAAVLNNCLERDLDARMTRTRRRPTADGTLPAGTALAAGLLAVAGGVSAVWLCGGALAATFAAAGAAYYVLVYTLLLKPRTAYSSLPGGLAGVFPALIGWTAAGGGLTGPIVSLCVLIAVWSPPHFWALAFALQDDYLASGVPTPPAVLGEKAAAKLIFAAAAALVALTLVPVAAGLYGPVYLLVVAPAGLGFLLVALAVARHRRRATALLLHKLSGPYLAAILAAMVAERLAHP
ncbi:MAG TPA: heme o synthase [Thermoleophilia bacterium]|nr:heme o synthase [Thermoleophilia bacterium]